MWILAKELSIIIAAIIVFAYYYGGSDEHKDINVHIETAPVQINLDKNKIIPTDYEGFNFNAFAQFSLTARVLGAERYIFGISSEISPVDLALGWQEMSKDEVVKRINVSQQRRWYYWSYSGDSPTSRANISRQSANMHMIPINEDVKDVLLDVKRNDIVKIEGYLVNVDGDDGFTWRSSSTRNDTGDGACEIILVTNIKIIEQ